LAEYIDGVDLSARGVGDVFDVPGHDGELLIAEEWAVRVVSPGRSGDSRTALRLNRVAEQGRRQLRLVQRQLRDIRTQIRRRLFEAHDHRRAEDRIRDAWHDEHATILNGFDPSR
jgi:hypothetical protein